MTKYFVISFSMLFSLALYQSYRSFVHLQEPFNVPPVAVLNVGRPEISYRSFGVTDALSPGPIFPPNVEEGWAEIEIPDPKLQDMPSHAWPVKHKGRTYLFHWSKEEQKLSIKEMERKWYAWIYDLWDWLKK